VVRTAKATAKATPFRIRAEFGAIEFKNVRASKDKD